MKKLKNIIIIPSNDVRPLNQLLNTHTLLRCEEALRLWKTNEHDLIVTSGGCTYNREIQTIPAAEIMKQWFIVNKVDESKILSENNSLDTYTNIHYSLELLKKNNIIFENLTIVSHWTHLVRIRIILWRNYKIKPVCVSVKYKLSCAEWLHEIIWFCYHLLDKTGYGFLEKKVREMIKKRASL